MIKSQRGHIWNILMGEKNMSENDILKIIGSIVFDRSFFNGDWGIPKKQDL